MTRTVSIAARPARGLALAIALAGAGTAFAAASPAEEASPQAAAPAIRPLAGVMLTGTVSTNKVPVKNPDGSTAVGSLSGRYEAYAGAEFPLEATIWYPINDKLRLGAGARYAMHTRFSGAGDKTADGLNPTPGVVFGAGYRLMPHLLLDLRYVYERYEGPGGGEYEASHWGAGLTAIY